MLKASRYLLPANSVICFWTSLTLLAMGGGYNSPDRQKLLYFLSLSFQNAIKTSWLLSLGYYLSKYWQKSEKNLRGAPKGPFKNLVLIKKKKNWNHPLIFKNQIVYLSANSLRKFAKNQRSNRLKLTELWKIWKKVYFLGIFLVCRICDRSDTLKGARPNFFSIDGFRMAPFWYLSSLGVLGCLF